MSVRPSSKVQLRQIIEERLAELRRALEGMEATGNYTAEEQEMHRGIVAEIDALEVQIRNAFTDH